MHTSSCVHLLQCKCGSQRTVGSTLFYHLGPREGTQVVRLGDRCLYYLSHPAGPCFFIFKLKRPDRVVDTCNSSSLWYWGRRITNSRPGHTGNLVRLLRMEGNEVITEWYSFAQHAQSLGFIPMICKTNPQANLLRIFLQCTAGAPATHM